MAIMHRPWYMQDLLPTVSFEVNMVNDGGNVPRTCTTHNFWYRSDKRPTSSLFAHTDFTHIEEMQEWLFDAAHLSMIRRVSRGESASTLRWISSGPHAMEKQHLHIETDLQIIWQWHQWLWTRRQVEINWSKDWWKEMDWDRWIVAVYT